jgi:hypothetical protein
MPNPQIGRQRPSLAQERASWHPTVSEERIVDAVERYATTLDNPGFCLSCGAEQGGCEPDMRRGKCEHCNERQVYGAEELLIRIM